MDAALPKPSAPPVRCERSLGRERFRSHNSTIGNHHRQKINQNPDLMKMAYPHFSRPNNC